MTEIFRIRDGVPHPQFGIPRSALWEPVSRRSFVRSSAFMTLGASALSGLIACSDSTAVADNVPTQIDVSASLGQLNFAYALAQMTYDYSTRLGLSPYPGITLAESATYSAMTSHDGVHSTFLQGYITHGRITDLLLFNFSSVDFGSQPSVLSSAVLIAETVSAGYAMLATMASDVSVATVLLKMASVKARHASFLRDLSDLRSGTASRVGFANDTVVGPSTGLATLLTPQAVLAAVGGYYKTAIIVSRS